MITHDVNDDFEFIQTHTHTHKTQRSTASPPKSGRSTFTVMLVGPFGLTTSAVVTAPELELEMIRDVEALRGAGPRMRGRVQK